MFSLGDALVPRRRSAASQPFKGRLAGLCCFVLCRWTVHKILTFRKEPSLLIEQKNTPPQPPADKRQKLRSWWAQVQCRTLLRRHSMRGVWQSKAEAAVQYLASNPVLLTLGEVFYVLGFCCLLYTSPSPRD